MWFLHRKSHCVLAPVRSWASRKIRGSIRTVSVPHQALLVCTVQNIPTALTLSSLLNTFDTVLIWRWLRRHFWKVDCYDLKTLWYNLSVHLFRLKLKKSYLFAKLKVFTERLLPFDKFKVSCLPLNLHVRSILSFNARHSLLCLSC